MTTGTTTEPTPSTTPDAHRDWLAWRATRESDLARPHDWLSVAAYHWVTTAADEPQHVPGVPGRWGVRGDALVAELTDEDGLRLVGPDGEPAAASVTGSVEVTVPEAGANRFLRHGDVLVEVLRRGGHYALRLRDPHAPTRRRFTGVPSYEYDPAWVLPVVTKSYAEARPVPVGAAAPGLTQVASTVGSVTVEIAGVAHTLVAVGFGDRWQLLFSDATSGVETAEWRIVPVRLSAPGHGVVDFNRAVNLPFAFTDFGTCPRPVAGNRLPVAVRAGEKSPTGRTGVAPTSGGPTALPTS